MAPTGNLKNKAGIAAACAAAAFLVGIIIYDTAGHTPEISKSGIAMGTVITEKLHGKNAQETAEEILERINEIESASLSWRIKGSDIYNVNAHAGKAESVGKNTLDWVKRTLEICKSSAGALDITVGRLTALWNIGDDSARLPSQPEIDGLLGAVGYGKVLISNGLIKLAEGQSLDMGAVGKGIACDEASQILDKNGIDSAIISVGGSILLFGGKDKIKVGIRNPAGAANDYMGVLNLKNCCISTSGDYEKVLEVNGKKYHHILDAKTGYPADSGLTSVTIVCKSGLLSDALSTACFVLGYKKSLPLLKEYDAEAVFITHNKSVYITQGLAGSFEITNTAYSAAGAENES